MGTGASFTGATALLPRDFTDGHGWLPEAHGRTMVLGDLDGRADVCGRGSAGLLCGQTTRD